MFVLMDTTQNLASGYIRACVYVCIRVHIGEGMGGDGGVKKKTSSTLFSDVEVLSKK